MDHVAIMKKSWGLIPKILSGGKIIESRWYMHKAAPWGKINKGEMVYFKNSGEKISLRVKVKRVMQFDHLNSVKVREILNEYGRQVGIAKSEEDKYYDLFKEKKYCLLIFLENPEIIEPFEINKTGFGAMAAWMCVKDIEEVKCKSRAPKSGG